VNEALSCCFPAVTTFCRSRTLPYRRSSRRCRATRKALRAVTATIPLLGLVRTRTCAPGAERYRWPSTAYVLVGRHAAAADTGRNRSESANVPATTARGKVIGGLKTDVGVITSRIMLPRKRADMVSKLLKERLQPNRRVRYWH